jgi:Branched-chain amino acid aminotransferase/4-amino-4-deoxychorismate lyase
MHSLISFNLQIIPASEAKISALSSAALYGSGVFTTVAVYDRKPFQWKKHWQRLSENAAKLNIRISDFDEETVAASLAELIEKNNVSTGRARITFYDEAASGIWSFETVRKTSLLITTADRRETIEELRLTLSPYGINSKSSLAGIKSCNYLESLLSLEESKSRGFDEAVRLNERGEVASACMANIFWIEGEALYTPPLETGCLEGTTRAAVIEIAQNSGFEVYTLAADYDELRRADEIFLTSAGIGIASVRRLENEIFSDDVTRRLKRDFYANLPVFS